MTKTLICILMLGLLISCGGDNKNHQVSSSSLSASSRSSDSSSSSESINLIQNQIRSNITGITYPLHIYLPPDYDSTQEYPVIYATDGQWVAEDFARSIQSANKAIILVAIEQGGDDRRAIDYPLPGSRQYFDFFRNELLPFIESQYSINTNMRTACGTSYGGLWVTTALLLDDPLQPLFKNYWAFDASYYYRVELLDELEQERFNLSNSMQVNLMLSTATLRGNYASVTAFESHMNSRHYSGLTITRRDFAVDHNDVASPSFKAALDIYF